MTGAQTSRDRRFGLGYHLNRDSLALAEAGAGDKVWAFTRRIADGAYFAAELVVRVVTSNRAAIAPGRFRVWVGLERSRNFDSTAPPTSREGARGTQAGRAPALRLKRGADRDKGDAGGLTA